MKKLLAIILATILMFSCMAVPASARVGNVGNQDPSYTEAVTVSIFDKIGDFFHDIIAKIFSAFGADCPMCDNHYGYGEAEGEGGYNAEEVAKIYNDAVNLFKKYNKQVKIDYAKDVALEVKDAPSMSSIRKVINDAVKGLAGRTESGKTYSYNSQSAINNLVPPSGRDSALSGANVNQITLNKINDTTKISFTLVQDEAYFDGTNTTGGAVYSTVLKPIDLAAIDFGTNVTLTSANISYNTVKVESVLDRYDRIISFKAVTDFEVSAEVKATIPFSTSVKGTITEEYKAEYLN